METLFIIIAICATHVAAFFAGAKNAERAAKLIKAAKDAKDAVKV